jgi:hypothetical protein
VAAKACAWVCGALRRLGTAAVDAAKLVMADAAHAYGLVFGLEACVFLAAALLMAERNVATGTVQGRRRAAVVPGALPYAREAVE